MKYILGGSNTIYNYLSTLECSKKINEIFVENCDILETFGSFIKLKPDNIKKSASKNIDRLRSYYMFQGCKLYVDSGGFQICTGKVKPEILDSVMHIYYEWLCENKSYDYAFTLDIPPAMTSYNGMDENMLNRKSYEIAVGLPDEIRKKMIYIHQFGSPTSYKLFRDMLVDLDVVNKFNFFSLGGLVGGYREFPVYPVVFGVIPIIRELKRNKKNIINLHILGQSNSAIVVILALLKKYIKQFHDIDTNITYDSVTPINDTFEFRKFYYTDENLKFQKIDLRKKKIGRIEIFSRVIDRKLKLLEEYDIDTSKFYEWFNEDNTKSRLLLFLITLIDMSRLGQMIDEMVENGIEIEDLLLHSNIKQKQNKLILNAYYPSLRLLESLDDDKSNYYYQNYVVNKKSEKTKLLTF